MGIKKFGDAGDGVILPEEGDNQKVAKANWTAEDEKALHEENKDKDAE